MATYLTLMLLFPLLGALLNALGGHLLPRRVVEVVACATVWGSFACALLAATDYTAPATVLLASWLATFDLAAPFSLYLDPLSLSLCVMITFVCGLIHLYSVFYMAGDEGYARFFALLNLFVFAMLTLVLAENLVLLYLGWEGVGFCSYLLIGFWYREKANADAGRKAFVTTRIGDTALVIAIAWLFRLSGSLSILQVNSLAGAIPPATVTAIGILLLIGATGKSAQLPLMVWLPDAMAGPTPVSALIHAATMVTAGVYLLARLFPLAGSSPTVCAAIALTGCLTAFYGATCALAQRDLKRVLAYSTISQIGYMTLGVGAGAITAATFHLLVHAFFKALLFLGAGCIITSFHHEQDIFRMGGARRSIPLTFWTFLAGAACLAGIPLTGGFFSKDSILGAVWSRGDLLYRGLYVLALLTALITAFYSFRLCYLVFGGEEKGHPHRTTQLRAMEIVLIPLALLGVFGGMLNLPGYLGEGFLGHFLASVPGGAPAEGSHAEEIALQAVAGAVALLGVAAAHLRYGAKRREDRMKESGSPSAATLFLLNGWYFDRLYDLIFIRPFRTLSAFLWERVDEGIIDDSLDRLGHFLGGCGSALGQWSSGKISLYLISFAAGCACILVYLAWVAL
ncbi:NADH-quinone oxidoreductase subunit L [Geomonas sp. RF6]|uniref:NADH-quinone oxidoreductase subunit L n=1 Tax=Geomonas sp. RF6 TaxID=2897342 RepID=UPI001E647C75|nr:NADH-quinone oxidoreductase subunit L [Geomonas sp. RF6]UFS72026.1 NADH-quinone oxidoreductase subunit L [Geomonas sp. RF6]